MNVIIGWSSADCMKDETATGKGYDNNDFFNVTYALPFGGLICGVLGLRVAKNGIRLKATA